MVEKGKGETSGPVSKKASFDGSQVETPAYCSLEIFVGLDMSLSVSSKAFRQRGAGGVMNHIMPAGFSPDKKHTWTQLAQWYGPWKGGNDPLYLAYPTKKNKTPLKCCQLGMTNDFKHIGAFARLDLS